jgi:uncharacterized protein (TIGR02246 family)
MSQLTIDDRLAIAEVLALYCHAIDHGQYEEFRALFTPDCTLDLRQALDVFEGAAGVRKFTDMMQAANVTMRHLTTNIVIRGDGDRARAHSYVLAITGPPGSARQMTGRYEDDLVKVDGRWRLRSRRLVLDMPAPPA